MIEVLWRTVAHAGELLGLGLATVGAMAAAFAAWRARRARPLPAPVLAVVPVLLVVFGTLLAVVRERTIVATVRSIGRDRLVAFVAQEHAAAAAGLGWWWALAAGVGVLGVWATGGLAARRPPVAWAAAGVALAGLGAIAQTADVLLYAGLWGVVATLPPGRHGAVLGAAGLTLMAAACGLEGALYRTLVLAEPERDLARMGTVYAACIAWLGPALLGVGAAVVERRAAIEASPRRAALTLVLAVGMVAGGLGAWRPSVARALSWGPPQGLAALSLAITPPLSGDAPRFVGGCVWSRAEGGWQAQPLGRVSPTHAIGACLPGVTEPVGQDRPILAVDQRAAVAALVRRGPGEVQILTRLAEAATDWRALVPWRWGTVVVRVLDPGVRRWRPLPSRFVVHRPGGHLVVEGPDGALHAADAAGVAAALQGASLRSDLVVLADAGVDVAGLVEVCRHGVAAHPQGLRCAVGRGPVERWR